MSSMTQHRQKRPIWLQQWSTNPFIKCFEGDRVLNVTNQYYNSLLFFWEFGKNKGRDICLVLVSLGRSGKAEVPCVAVNRAWSQAVIWEAVLSELKYSKACGETFRLWIGLFWFFGLVGHLCISLFRFTLKIKKMQNQAELGGVTGNRASF